MKSLHGGKTGIIWVDAHADFNTSPDAERNIHGMVLAVHTGRGDPRLTAIHPLRRFGNRTRPCRRADRTRTRTARDSAVTVFTMRDIVGAA